MRAFFRQISDALKEGQAAVLVSVLSATGSTPRGAGAMMAVFSREKSCGTIGGGNVEYEAQQLAEDLLHSGGNARRTFRFVQGDAASLGMVCGGDVELHFQFLSPEDQEVISVFERLAELCGTGEGAWLVRQIRQDAVEQMRAVGGKERAELPVELSDYPVTSGEWQVIPVERPGYVYVFGGGHVSQELVKAISAVGFRTVVYDDRAEFASAERFPQVQRVICGSFLNLSESVTVTERDYVVVMTRGHQADYEVLTQVLRSAARYIGCIGSRKKLAICRERLLKDGFTAEEYARIHAPIGLDIGAETPEEIAVSVAAEMIAVRAGMKRGR